MILILAALTVASFMLSVETAPATERATVIVAVVTTIGAIAVANISSARAAKRAIGRHADDSSERLERIEAKLDETRDVSILTEAKVDDVRKRLDTHDRDAQQRGERIARLEAWRDNQTGDNR